jgi:hypothetical protein
MKSASDISAMLVCHSGNTSLARADPARYRQWERQTQKSVSQKSPVSFTAIPWALAVNTSHTAAEVTRMYVAGDVKSRIK